MADGIRDIHQEYWRPLNNTRISGPGQPAREATCSCGTEYLFGAQYCHVCGAGREPKLEFKKPGGIARWFDFDNLRELTGLRPLSLALFITGVLSAVGALATCLIHPDATSLLEAEGQQLWRIQLLLGSAVAFLGCIALKRDSR